MCLSIDPRKTRRYVVTGGRTATRARVHTWMYVVHAVEWAGFDAAWARRRLVRAQVRLGKEKRGEL